MVTASVTSWRPEAVSKNPPGSLGEPASRKVGSGFFGPFRVIALPTGRLRTELWMQCRKRLHGKRLMRRR
jgi:hypothetical protein